MTGGFYAFIGFVLGVSLTCAVLTAVGASLDRRAYKNRDPYRQEK